MGSHQFQESLRELLRELWFSYCSSRGMPFREWNFVFREWNFEFRELLREYPGTLRELQEWPFHSESVFPEIGVVPRLLKSDHFVRSEKFQNESSPKFSNFRPEFCPEVYSKFPEFIEDCSCFDPQTVSKAKSTKVFWRAGRVAFCSTIAPE